MILRGKYVIYGAIMALFLVLAGGYSRINYLNSKVESLKADITLLSDTVAVYYNANQINYANVKDLSTKLEMCQLDNMVLEADGRVAAKEFNNTLTAIKGKVDDQMQQVRRMLQKETCASVYVPSDVNKLLHDGASRANGTG